MSDLSKMINGYVDEVTVKSCNDEFFDTLKKIIYTDFRFSFDQVQQLFGSFEYSSYSLNNSKSFKFESKCNIKYIRGTVLINSYTVPRKRKIVLNFYHYDHVNNKSLERIMKWEISFNDNVFSIMFCSRANLQLRKLFTNFIISQNMKYSSSWIYDIDSHLMHI